MDPYFINPKPNPKLTKSNCQYLNPPSLSSAPPSLSPLDQKKKIKKKLKGRSLLVLACGPHALPFQPPLLLLPNFSSPNNLSIPLTRSLSPQWIENQPTQSEPGKINPYTSPITTRKNWTTRNRSRSLWRRQIIRWLRSPGEDLAAQECPRSRCARPRSAWRICPKPRGTTGAIKSARRISRLQSWWSPASTSGSASNAAGMCVLLTHACGRDSFSHLTINCVWISILSYAVI